MAEEINLSICIACYNHELYIKQCLDSVVQYENNRQVEIVIINDCSTDDSHNQITQRIEINQSIKVIYHSNIENRGPGYTYNQAYKYSSGQYISFMDSDDYFTGSSLQHKIQLLEQDDQSMMVYGNGSFLMDRKILKSSLHTSIEKLLFKHNPGLLYQAITEKIPLLSLSASVIRRELLDKIGGFDESRFSLNDRVLNIKMMQYLMKYKLGFLYNETKVFAYRIHNNNISKNPQNQYECFDYIIHTYCPSQNYLSLMREITFVTAIRYKVLGNTQGAYKYYRYLLTYTGGYIQKVICYVILHIPSSIIEKLYLSFRKLKHHVKGTIF